MNIAFLSANHEDAKKALGTLQSKYDGVSFKTSPEEADIIVAIGGDGFLLKTLHEYRRPVFGLHRGTVGFLLNQFKDLDLEARLENAERTIIHPLAVKVENADGSTTEDIAINEMSLLRASPQAAKLAIKIDSKIRQEELVCDGVLVSTPVGSTAYNLSAHGTVLPLNANLLALTPISPFRPRRWRGALLSQDALIEIEILKQDHRPVRVAVDDRDYGRNAIRVFVKQDKETELVLMHDADSHLEERILAEQFQG